MKNVKFAKGQVVIVNRPLLMFQEEWNIYALIVVQ